MDVTVTIPTLNEENYLPRCLEDLETSIDNFEGEVEVIIVDSYSTDKTVQIAENSAVVDKVIQAEKGILKARDKGIRNASNPIVICMDADTGYTDNYITDITRPLIQENKTIAYGPAKGEKGLHIDSFMRFILQNTLPWVGLAWVNGSNRAFKKQDYIDLGGYNLSKDGKSVMKVMYEEQFKFPLKLGQKGEGLSATKGMSYVKEAKSFQSHRTMDQMLLLERKDGGKSWGFINHYQMINHLKAFLQSSYDSVSKRKSSRQQSQPNK